MQTPAKGVLAESSSEDAGVLFTDPPAPFCSLFTDLLYHILSPLNLLKLSTCLQELKGRITRGGIPELQPGTTEQMFVKWHGWANIVTAVTAGLTAGAQSLY